MWNIFLVAARPIVPLEGKKMKFVSFLLSLLLLCVLASSAFGQNFPVNGKITTKKENDLVNVRSGPGLDYKTVGKLSRSKVITVLAQEGKWYKIRIPAEIPLYIPRRYVKAGEKDASGERIGIVTHNRVEMRSGLASDDTSLGKAYEDDRVVITGEKGTWYIIKGHGRAAGYISNRHVELLKTARVTPVPIKPTEPQKKIAQPKPPALRKTPINDADFLKRLDAALDKDNPDIEKARLILDEWDKENRSAPEADRPTREQLIADYRARREDARRELEKAKESTGPLKEYIGRIDDVGLLLFPPPGGFKLLKGDEVVYYLKSNKPAIIKLGKYLFRRVAITGTVEEIKGWEQPLIRVVSIRLLDADETGEDDDESNSDNSDE